jgi:TPR repeat protein
MLRSLTIALTLAATPALALVPINQEPVIGEKLLQGFIGDAIADNCPTMKARTLKALGELNALRDYALEQGYEASVVREFVTSKAEKAKFKALAAEWLKAKGAEPGNPDAYCKIGEEEIAKESLVGSLLRSTK